METKLLMEMVTVSALKELIHSEVTKTTEMEMI